VRKQTPVQQRSHDECSHVGRFRQPAEFASASRSSKDDGNRLHKPGLDGGEDRREIPIPLRRVHERQQDRGVRTGQELLDHPLSERAQVTGETLSIWGVEARAHACACIEQERLTRGPVPIDGGLGHARPSGDGIDGHTGETLFRQQLVRRRHDDVLRVTDAHVDIALAIAAT
jgi:hypothetical protein